MHRPARNQVMSMKIASIALLALGSASLLGSIARAEEAAPKEGMSRIVWATRPAFDLSDPRAKSGDLHTKIETKTGVAAIGPTAVDHHFASDKVGSVGYLCGLAPGPNESGGVASGYEPAGTFLGGQFKLAFK
jgi:hypothetical protein